MDYMIVSYSHPAIREMGVWTWAKMRTLDVPLGNFELHPLHSRLPSDAREHRGQWVGHSSQVGQEQEPKRETVRPKLYP